MKTIISELRKEFTVLETFEFKPNLKSFFALTMYLSNVT